MSDVLKKYSIVIGADTKELMDKLNTVEKELKNKLGDIDLGSGVREDINELTKQINILKNNINTAKNEINEGIRKIETDHMKGEFKELKNSITSEIHDIQLSISGLQKSIKVLNDAGGFETLGNGVEKTLSKIDNSVSELESKITEFRNIFSTGATIITAPLEQIVSDSQKSLKKGIDENMKYVEKAYKNAEQSLKNLRLYQEKGINGVFEGRKVKSTDLQVWKSDIENVIDALKMLPENYQFIDDISIESFKRNATYIKNLLKEIQKNKEQVSGTESEITLHWKTELDADSTVESLKNKIDKYQEEIQEYFEKNPIHIKTELEKNDFKESVSKFIDEQNKLYSSPDAKKIKVNLEVGSLNTSKVDKELEKSVAELESMNSSSSINTDSKDINVDSDKAVISANTINAQNVSANLINDGSLASENTLQDIKHILEGFGKNGRLMLERENKGILSEKESSAQVNLPFDKYFKFLNLKDIVLDPSVIKDAEFVNNELKKIAESIHLRGDYKKISNAISTQKDDEAEQAFLSSSYYKRQIDINGKKYGTRYFVKQDGSLGSQQLPYEEFKEQAFEEFKQARKAYKEIQEQQKQTIEENFNTIFNSGSSSNSDLVSIVSKKYRDKIYKSIVDSNAIFKGVTDKEIGVDVFPEGTKEKIKNSFRKKIAAEEKKIFDADSLISEYETMMFDDSTESGRAYHKQINDSIEEAKRIIQESESNIEKIRKDFGVKTELRKGEISELITYEDFSRLLGVDEKSLNTYELQKRRYIENLIRGIQGSNGKTLSETINEISNGSYSISKEESDALKRIWSKEFDARKKEIKLVFDKLVSEYESSIDKSDSFLAGNRLKVTRKVNSRNRYTEVGELTDPNTTPISSSEKDVKNSIVARWQQVQNETNSIIDWANSRYQDLETRLSKFNKVLEMNDSLQNGTADNSEEFRTNLSTLTQELIDSEELVDSQNNKIKLDTENLYEYIRKMREDLVAERDSLPSLVSQARNNASRQISKLRRDNSNSYGENLISKITEQYKDDKEKQKQAVQNEIDRLQRANDEASEKNRLINNLITVTEEETYIESTDKRKGHTKQKGELNYSNVSPYLYKEYEQRGHIIDENKKTIKALQLFQKQLEVETSTDGQLSGQFEETGNIVSSVVVNGHRLTSKEAIRGYSDMSNYSENSSEEDLKLRKKDLEAAKEELSIISKKGLEENAKAEATAVVDAVVIELKNRLSEKELELNHITSSISNPEKNIVGFKNADESTKKAYLAKQQKNATALKKEIEDINESIDKYTGRTRSAEERLSKLQPKFIWMKDSIASSAQSASELTNELEEYEKLFDTAKPKLYNDALAKSEELENKILSVREQYNVAKENGDKKETSRLSNLYKELKNELEVQKRIMSPFENDQSFVERYISATLEEKKRQLDQAESVIERLKELESSTSSKMFSMVGDGKYSENLSNEQKDKLISLSKKAGLNKDDRQNFAMWSDLSKLNEEGILTSEKYKEARNSIEDSKKRLNEIDSKIEEIKDKSKEVQDLLKEKHELTGKQTDDAQNRISEIDKKLNDIKVYQENSDELEKLYIEIQNLEQERSKLALSNPTDEVKSRSNEIKNRLNEIVSRKNDIFGNREITSLLEEKKTIESSMPDAKSFIIQYEEYIENIERFQLLKDKISSNLSEKEQLDFISLNSQYQKSYDAISDFMEYYGKLYQRYSVQGVNSRDKIISDLTRQFMSDYDLSAEINKIDEQIIQIDTFISKREELLKKKQEQEELNKKQLEEEQKLRVEQENIAREQELSKQSKYSSPTIDSEIQSKNEELISTKNRESEVKNELESIVDELKNIDKNEEAIKSVDEEIESIKQNLTSLQKNVIRNTTQPFIDELQKLGEESSPIVSKIKEIEDAVAKGLSHPDFANLELYKKQLNDILAKTKNVESELLNAQKNDQKYYLDELDKDAKEYFQIQEKIKNSRGKEKKELQELLDIQRQIIVNDVNGLMRVQSGMSKKISAGGKLVDNPNILPIPKDIQKIYGKDDKYSFDNLTESINRFQEKLNNTENREKEIHANRLSRNKEIANLEKELFAMYNKGYVQSDIPEIESNYNDSLNQLNKLKEKLVYYESERKAAIDKGEDIYLDNLNIDIKETLEKISMLEKETSELSFLLSHKDMIPDYSKTTKSGKKSVSYKKYQSKAIEDSTKLKLLDDIKEQAGTKTSFEIYQDLLRKNTEAETKENEELEILIYNIKKYKQIIEETKSFLSSDNSLNSFIGNKKQGIDNYGYDKRKAELEEELNAAEKRKQELIDEANVRVGILETKKEELQAELELLKTKKESLAVEINTDKVDAERAKRIQEKISLRRFSKKTTDYDKYIYGAADVQLEDVESLLEKYYTGLTSKKKKRYDSLVKKSKLSDYELEKYNSYLKEEETYSRTGKTDELDNLTSRNKYSENKKLLSDLKQQLSSLESQLRIDTERFKELTSQEVITEEQKKELLSIDIQSRKNEIKELNKQISIVESAVQKYSEYYNIKKKVKSLSKDELQDLQSLNDIQQQFLSIEREHERNLQKAVQNKESSIVEAKNKNNGELTKQQEREINEKYNSEIELENKRYNSVINHNKNIVREQYAAFVKLASILTIIDKNHNVARSYNGKNKDYVSDIVSQFVGNGDVVESEVMKAVAENAKVVAEATGKAVEEEVKYTRSSATAEKSKSINSGYFDGMTDTEKQAAQDLFEIQRELDEQQRIRNKIVYTEGKITAEEKEKLLDETALGELKEKARIAREKAEKLGLEISDTGYVKPLTTDEKSYRIQLAEQKLDGYATERTLVKIYQLLSTKFGITIKDSSPTSNSSSNKIFSTKNQRKEWSKLINEGGDVANKAAKEAIEHNAMIFKNSDGNYFVAKDKPKGSGNKDVTKEFADKLGIATDKINNFTKSIDSSAKKQTKSSRSNKNSNGNFDVAAYKRITKELADKGIVRLRKNGSPYSDDREKVYEEMRKQGFNADSYSSTNSSRSKSTKKVQISGFEKDYVQVTKELLENGILKSVRKSGAPLSGDRKTVYEEMQKRGMGTIEPDGKFTYGKHAKSSTVAVDDNTRAIKENSESKKENLTADKEQLDYSDRILAGIKRQSSWLKNSKNPQKIKKHQSDLEKWYDKADKDPLLRIASGNKDDYTAVYEKVQQNLTGKESETNTDAEHTLIEKVQELQQQIDSKESYNVQLNELISAFEDSINKINNYLYDKKGNPSKNVNPQELKTLYDNYVELASKVGGKITPIEELLDDRTDDLLERFNALSDNQKTADDSSSKKRKGLIGKIKGLIVRNKSDESDENKQVDTQTEELKKEIESRNENTKAEQETKVAVEETTNEEKKKSNIAKTDIDLTNKSESELVELYKQEKNAIKNCSDEEKVYHETQKSRIKDALSSSTQYKYRGGKSDTFVKQDNQTGVLSSDSTQSVQETNDALSEECKLEIQLIELESKRKQIAQDRSNSTNSEERANYTRQEAECYLEMIPLLERYNSLSGQKDDKFNFHSMDGIVKNMTSAANSLSGNGTASLPFEHLLKVINMVDPGGISKYIDVLKEFINESISASDAAHKITERFKELKSSQPNQNPILSSEQNNNNDKTTQQKEYIPGATKQISYEDINNLISKLGLADDEAAKLREELILIRDVIHELGEYNVVSIDLSSFDTKQIENIQSFFDNRGIITRQREGYMSVYDPTEITQSLSSEMAKSYVQGVDASTEEMKQAWKVFSELGIETVKQIYDIHSPSKVMYQLGLWTVEGFTDAIKNGADSIKSSIQNALKEGRVTEDEVRSLIGWNGFDLDAEFGKRLQFNKRSDTWKNFSSVINSEDLFNYVVSSQETKSTNTTDNKQKKDYYSLSDVRKMFSSEKMKFTSEDESSIKSFGEQTARGWKLAIDKVDEYIAKKKEALASSTDEASDKSEGNIEKLVNSTYSRYKNALIRKNNAELAIENKDITNKTINAKINAENEIAAILKVIDELREEGIDLTEKELEISRLKEQHEQNLLTTKLKYYDIYAANLRNENTTNTNYVNQIDILEQKILELKQLSSQGILTTEEGQKAKELRSEIETIISELEGINGNKNLSITQYSSLSDANQIKNALYNMQGINKETVKIANSGKEISGVIKDVGGASKTIKYTWNDTLGVFVKSTDVLTSQLSVWDRLKAQVKKSATYFSHYFSGYMIAQRIISTIRQGITYIKELDSSLTEMKKVSDETTVSLKNFQKQSFETAKSIGSTATEIQNSAADFMRLGYSLKEAAQLSKDANIYANVGDMDIDTATEHMISSIKAWESEFSSATEASISLIDKYNEIGNNYAITSADIGSAMERSAAALKVAGNTVDESIGLITAGNLIQQDADTTANALKVLSLRIRGSKTDLEDMGEETDDLASSTSKLRKEIQALTGVDIMMNDTTYKSTAQIIQEIGAVWDKLSDVSKATTLEKLAGKTRASVVAGLLENYETIAKVAEDSANAEGSAMRENLEYMDSIAGRMAQLTTQAQEFWSALIDSDTVKEVTSFLTYLMSALTKITSFAGGTGLAGMAAGLFTSFSGAGIFRRSYNEENDSYSYGTIFSKDYKIDKDIISKYNQEISNVAINSKKSGKIVNKYLEKTTGRTRELIKASNGETIALNKMSAASKSSAIAMNLLNAAINIGIGLAISLVLKGINYLIHYQENLVKAVEESSQKFNDVTNELKELNDELKTTVSRINELQTLEKNNTISIAEQDELNLLKEKNKELEKQIVLKKQEQIIAAKKSLKALGKLDYNVTSKYEFKENTNGRSVDVGLKIDRATELEHAIDKYKKQYEYVNDVASQGLDTTLPQQYLDDIGNYIDSLFGEDQQNALKAYQDLIDAGETLVGTDLDHYNELVKLRDTYLMYCYTIQQTESAYKALNAEQKKVILTERLVLQGLSQEEIDAVLNNLSDEDLDILYNPNKDYPINFVFNYKNTESYDELKSLGEDGSVNLTVRPVVDNSALKDAGWSDIEEDGYATVYSSTYSNEEGTVAMNFTPIIADPETGEFKGVLSPEKLQEYAEGVINGTREDDLNLKIGTTFTGENAIDEACEAANQIHEQQIINAEDYGKAYAEKWLEGTEEVVETEKKKDSYTDIADFLSFSSNSKIRDDLIGLAQAGKLDSNTIKDYKYYNEILKELGLSASVSDEKLESMVNTINSMAKKNPVDYLNNYKNQLKNLNDAYINFKKGERIDSATMSELQDNFGYLKSYQDFQKAVMSGETDLQKYFDAMATELSGNVLGTLTDVMDVTDGLTEENKEYYETELELIGIENAHDVVEDALANKQKYRNKILEQLNDANKKFNYTNKDLIINENELVDAEYDTIQTFIDEANAVNLATNELQLYALTKINSSDISLNNLNDINYLIKLAENAGIATSKISAFGKAKAAVEKIEYWSSLTQKEDMNGRRFQEIAKYEAELKQYESDLSKELNDKAKEKYEISLNTGLVFDGGKDVEDALKSSSETFDWIETKLSRLQRKITNLGKVVSSTWRNWTSRNNALISEISEVNNEIALQKQAMDAYLTKASSIGLSQEYANRVMNGNLSIEEITDEDLKEQINKFKEWYEKALSCSDAIEDLKSNLAELAKTKFDNVSKQFDNAMMMALHEADMINTFISQTEEAGMLASKKYYEVLIQNQTEQVNQLTEKYSSLADEFNNAVSSGAVEMYSDAWYEMLSGVNEVEKAIQDANTELIKFNNTLRQIDWDIFDKKVGMVDNITSESEFLISMMEYYDLFDEYGKMTEEGLTTQGLRAMNYNVYMERAAAYAEEMQKVQEEIDKEPENTKLQDRYNELVKAQQESITNAINEKKAIQSLVSDGYNKLSESLQKFIDKRKEALNMKSDLYDYEKNIREQTKSIASYRKQLLAYQGDDSEETRATVQKLKLSLEDAEEKLQETQYDKWKSDQERMLDDFSNDTQTWINKRLAQTDLLVSEAVKATNEGADKIAETITDTSSNYGYQVSKTMEDIWTNTDSPVVGYYNDVKDGISKGLEKLDKLNTLDSIDETISNNMKQSLENIDEYLIQPDGFDKTLDSKTTTVQSTIQNVGIDVDNAVKAVDKFAQQNAANIASLQNALISSQSNSSSNQSSNAQVSTTPQVTTTTKKETNKDDEKDKKVTTPTSYVILGGATVYSGTDSECKSYISKNNLKLSAPTTKNTSGGYNYYVVAIKPSDISSNKFNSSPYAKYAGGSKNIDKEQLAWTQDGGQELVYRKSDGAMLTRLSAGDKVFTKEMTDRLWEFASDSYVKPVNLPSLNTNETINSNVQMSITLPNVTNYNDFVTQLQADKRFEKIVQNMTVGQAVGKNSLSKFKH